MRDRHARHAVALPPPGAAARCALPAAAAGRRPHVDAHRARAAGRRARRLNERMSDTAVPSLATVVREWGRIGCIGFGGPPAHIALLRRLVRRRSAVAARPRSSRTRSRRATCCPGRRRRSSRSSARGGCAGRSVRWRAVSRSSCPGWSLILALSALFLESSPPRGSAVPVPVPGRRWRPSRCGPPGICCGRAGGASSVALRWLVYAARRRGGRRAAGPGWSWCCSRAGVRAGVRGPLCGPRRAASFLPLPAAVAAGTGGSLSLVWTAFKVGALSYGGGFVIVPLMQGDAVGRYHWLTREPVPERRRPRPDHAGPGRADGRGGGLRRGRDRRRAAGRAGCVLAVVRLRAARRRRLRAARGRTVARTRVPGRRRPRRDRRDPRRRRAPDARPDGATGSTPCWPPPRSCSSPPVAASSSPWSRAGGSASWWPWRAARCPAARRPRRRSGGTGRGRRGATSSRDGRAGRRVGRIR